MNFQTRMGQATPTDLILLAAGAFLHWEWCRVRGPRREAFPQIRAPLPKLEPKAGVQLWGMPHLVGLTN